MYVTFCISTEILRHSSYHVLSCRHVMLCMSVCMLCVIYIYVCITLGMTDKTPHESLPIRSADDKMIIYRHYFRLVVGGITAWFADHSTTNPLGVVPPESVRIVYGSKFELYHGISHSWSTGLRHELVAAEEEKKLRLKCIEYGLGHLADRLVLCGVTSIDALLEKEDATEHIHLIFGDDHTGGWYYEYPQLEQMMTDLRERALTTTH